MDFAKQATGKLSDQAPELSKYVTAFKDLSDELPDNYGIEVGMFILSIRSGYFYVPVISRNGTVQPIESIFCATEKEFKPLTKKTVKHILESDPQIGKAERIPGSVAKNPDLYDAIVPPKTGKYVYASEGRLIPFVATLGNEDRDLLLSAIEKSAEHMTAINNVLPFDDLANALKDRVGPEPKPAAPEVMPEVITSAVDLNEEQIQEVLSKGYTVKNPPKSTRVAVEAEGTDAFTQVRNMLPGEAYTAFTKSGRPMSVACLKRVETPQGDQAFFDKNKHIGHRTKSPAGNGPLIVTSEGSITECGSLVVYQRPIKYDDVIDELGSKSISEVSKGDHGLVFTGAGYLGPVHVCDIVIKNGWTTIDVAGAGVRQLRIHPSSKGLYCLNGDTAYITDVAKFVPLNQGPLDLETDINAAQIRHEMEEAKILPVSANLMHRDGTFAVDGKEIGGNIQLIEHALNTWHIDVPTVEALMQSAKTKGNVTVRMTDIEKFAAVRGGSRPTKGSGTQPSPMPEYGEKVSPDPQMTGTARQRAEGMSNKIKNAADVQDREILEATIMAEMLNNPSLHDSIQEYLPEIKEAIDKLGRSLFLIRLNTAKLADEIDAEALNNLITSTRNTYRNLGETYIELRNLAQGA